MLLLNSKKGFSSSLYCKSDTQKELKKVVVTEANAYQFVFQTLRILSQSVYRS